MLISTSAEQEREIHTPVVNFEFLSEYCDSTPLQAPQDILSVVMVVHPESVDTPMLDIGDSTAEQYPPPVPPRPDAEETDNSITKRRRDSAQASTPELNIRIHPGSSVNLEVGPAAGPARRSESPEKVVRAHSYPSTSANTTSSSQNTRSQVDKIPEPSIVDEQLYRGLIEEERLRKRQAEEELEIVRAEIDKIRVTAEKDLERERNLRSTKELELQERNLELEDIRRRWKQSAKELGKLRLAQDQAFYQVTDSDLIDMATRLQYNIRSFSIQYFTGRPPKSVKFDNLDYFSFLQDVTHNYKLYLFSPDYCQHIIQGFLWRILCYRVFGRFYWIPGHNGIAAARLNRTLEPRKFAPNSFSSRSVFVEVPNEIYRVGRD